MDKVNYYKYNLNIGSYIVLYILVYIVVLILTIIISSILNLKIMMSLFGLFFTFISALLLVILIGRKVDKINNKYSKEYIGINKKEIHLPKIIESKEKVIKKSNIKKIVFVSYKSFNIWYSGLSKDYNSNQLKILLKNGSEIVISRKNYDISELSEYLEYNYYDDLFEYKKKLF